MYFVYYICTEKLRFPSRSCQTVLCILQYDTCKVATLELDLPKCTSCATFVLKSCDFPTGAAKLYFVYRTDTCKVATLELDLPKCTLCIAFVLKSFRFPSRSCQTVLCILHYDTCKVATLELDLPKCTSCTTFLLKSCDFPAGAAKLYFVYCNMTLVKMRLWS